MTNFAFIKNKQNTGKMQDSKNKWKKNSWSEVINSK